MSKANVDAIKKWLAEMRTTSVERCRGEYFEDIKGKGQAGAVCAIGLAIIEDLDGVGIERTLGSAFTFNGVLKYPCCQAEDKLGLNRHQQMDIASINDNFEGSWTELADKIEDYLRSWFII